MTRDDVIERLCKLCSEAWRAAVPDASEPNDCVCTKRYEGQLAVCDMHGGSPEEYFRHGATAIEFMETAVREAIKRIPGDPKEADEGDA